MSILHAPTPVHMGSPWLAHLSKIIPNGPWALLTTKGWKDRGLEEEIRNAGVAQPVWLPPVPAHPTEQAIFTLSQAVPKETTQIVAVGGGSVLDAAKGIKALHILRGSFDAFYNHLRKGTPLPTGPGNLSLTAVPTTAGTGSEVTPWGTIWGEDGNKSSVIGPALFFNAAILDPQLTVSLPRKITLSSGLDALSHSLEALWNHHHNVLSDRLAITSAREILSLLPAVLAAPDDQGLRTRMQVAALMSGLAMGMTRTALAHSISYPFTAHCGVPHGLACAITLPEVFAFVVKKNPDRMEVTREIFQCSPEQAPKALIDFIDSLGVAEYLFPLLETDPPSAVLDELTHPGNTGNTIGNPSAIDAEEVLQSALQRWRQMHRDS